MQTDVIASIHLGKKSEGSTCYNPSLLVAVPRNENRKIYGIEDLPFYGYDIWHAYEFSCLAKNGLPVTRLLKLKYNCDNEFIIESKSLKLYLNSFNMTRLGDNSAQCLLESKKLIEYDLAEKLKTKVDVNFLENNSNAVKIYQNYKKLTDFIDEKSIQIEQFKESPELLKVEDIGLMREYRYTFDSLRSNCRVTHQPDFGDAFIYYKSHKHINEQSLVEYLTSFRSEYHFHEECCEMIFKRLYDILDKDDELMVCALYTRRGGIDICPVRWSKNCNIVDFSDLVDVKKFARCGIKQ